MPGTLVSVRMHPELLAQARRLAAARETTVQDFIRQSLQYAVDRDRLSGLYGSQPVRPDLTQEERDALAEELLPPV